MSKDKKMSLVAVILVLAGNFMEAVCVTYTMKMRPE